MSEHQGLILVIDDEEDLRDMVQYQLESKGYHVETAVDGLDGLEKLKSITPTLIILDMNMPRMGGIEFYKRIADDSGATPYPVLVLTARANLEGLFEELHVDGFIPKPFEIPDLLSRIESILSQTTKSVAASSHSTEHICVIDDDPDRSAKLCFKLLKEGYAVNYASGGKQGLKMVAGVKPALALVRLGLKDLPGDEVILQLHRDDSLKKVKYILYQTDASYDTNVTDLIQQKDAVNFVEIGGMLDPLVEKTQALLL